MGTEAVPQAYWAGPGGFAGWVGGRPGPRWNALGGALVVARGQTLPAAAPRELQPARAPALGPAEPRCAKQRASADAT